MTSEHFQDALKELKLSGPEFAGLIEVNERVIQQWALGKSPVPAVVELLLVFATHCPDSFKEIVEARRLLNDEL